MQKMTIPVHGMSCGGCVSSVSRVLDALDGVESAVVTLQPAQAEVALDPVRVDADALVVAIRGAGFEVPADWRPPPAGV